MAETAITITETTKWLAGENPTVTVGDASTDHLLDISKPVCLLVINSSAASGGVGWKTTTGAAKATYNAATDITNTIGAGVNVAQAIWYDVPTEIAYSGNSVWIGTTNANFSYMRLYAVSGIKSS